MPATSAAMTFPATTWYSRMAARPAGSARSASSVPAGSAANAASVGAKTVKGPSPRSVSSRPPAWTAVTSVVKSPAAMAVSTMSSVAVASVPSVVPPGALVVMVVMVVIDDPAVVSVVLDAVVLVVLSLEQALRPSASATAAATGMRRDVAIMEGSSGRWGSPERSLTGP
jgi:hypothetical protein